MIWVIILSYLILGKKSSESTNNNIWGI
jgi:hypothetical protein